MVIAVNFFLFFFIYRERKKKKKKRKVEILKKVKGVPWR